MERFNVAKASPDTLIGILDYIVQLLAKEKDGQWHVYDTPLKCEYKKTIEELRYRLVKGSKRG